ncbi:MAG: hypothetical protein ACKOYP_02305, partial [Bacteroidota bacterium]
FKNQTRGRLFGHPTPPGSLAQAQPYCKDLFPSLTLVAYHRRSSGLIAFNRVDGSEELLVLHNLSGQPHTVDLPSGKSGLLFSTMRGTGISGRSLTIPAGGSAVVGN